MGQKALLPFRRKGAEDFFALKNPSASVRFEPANLGTKGQHPTFRQPKPLESEFTSCICRIFNWIWILMFYVCTRLRSDENLLPYPSELKDASGTAWVRPTEHCKEHCDVTKWVLTVRWRVRQLIYCPHSRFLLVSVPSYWLTRNKCSVTGLRLIIRTVSKRSPSDVDVRNTATWKLLLLPPVGFNLQQLRLKFQSSS